MRLRARVRRATRKTRHYYGHIDRDHVVKDTELPTPAYVEIEPSGDGAFYLFYFDAKGVCMTDTWHESVERAKAQAEFEFEITEQDWEDVAP